MSDLNHHDEEEYHFDDSESFDFGESEATEEEFVGEDEATEATEETETKKWSNERAVAESGKKAETIKKASIAVGAVIVFIVVGYFFMKPKAKVAPSIPSVNIAPASTAEKSAVEAAPVVAKDSTMDANANTNLGGATDGAWLGDADGGDASASPSKAPPIAENAPTQGSVPDDTSVSMQIQTLNQENQTLTLKLQQVSAKSEETAARADSLEKLVLQLQEKVNKMGEVSNTAPVQTPRPVTAAPAASSKSNANTTSVSESDSKNSLVYYVQAIIPGRAWIGDSNGRIITVTQGDRIVALNSTVKTIDPINGMVTLNNGMQIEYGMVAQ